MLSAARARPCVLDRPTDRRTTTSRVLAHHHQCALGYRAVRVLRNQSRVVPTVRVTCFTSAVVFRCISLLIFFIDFFKYLRPSVSFRTDRTVSGFRCFSRPSVFDLAPRGRRGRSGHLLIFPVSAVESETRVPPPTDTTFCSDRVQSPPPPPTDGLVGGGVRGLGRRRAVAEGGGRPTAAAAYIDHHHGAGDAPVPEDHRAGRPRFRVSFKGARV